jgi:hypothetical protein
MALLVPAAAGRGATTIGVPSPAGGSLSNTGCGDNCTFLPALASDPAFTTANRGVLVRWRIVSDSENAVVALRVLRPSGGQFKAVATSAVEHTTQPSTVDLFSTRLRMAAGDALGLDNQNSALLFKPMASSGVYVRWTSPFLADGASSPFTDHNSGGAFELQINADLEPDADGDGFGDQSQDGCPGDRTRQTPPCAAGPANPGATPPPTPGDTTAPVLSGLGVTPRAFRLGRTTKIAFRLSETARIRLAFARLLPGRRRGTRCVPALATGRRCSAARSRGSVTLRAQGRQSVTFDGRVTAGLLAPGRYRITATAVDLAGNPSRVVTASFTLLPRARRRG